MLRLKICGITSLEDALAAAEAGADAVGFVFADSPRRVSPETAARIVAGLPAFVTPVGVFVDEAPERVLRIARETGLAAVQLHGDEPPEAIEALAPLACIKAFRIRSRGDLERLAGYRARGYLVDTYVADRPGGTGEKMDWDMLAGFQPPGPLILAGGLTAENVAEAVRRVRPYAVDVSGGVEAEPGRKDHALVKRFIQQARWAEAEEDPLGGQAAGSDPLKQARERS